MINNTVLKNQLKRRVNAVYTILRCLDLPNGEIIDVLTHFVCASRSAVLRTLEVDGLLKGVSSEDFDACPELKTLKSSSTWSRLISETYCFEQEILGVYRRYEDYTQWNLYQIFRYWVVEHDSEALSIGKEEADISTMQT